MPEVQASNPLFYFQSIKIILGPSDTWSMRWSTQSDLEYYIKDYWIFCNAGITSFKCDRDHTIINIYTPVKGQLIIEMKKESLIFNIVSGSDANITRWYVKTIRPDLSK